MDKNKISMHCNFNDAMNAKSQILKIMDHFIFTCIFMIKKTWQQINGMLFVSFFWGGTYGDAQGLHLVPYSEVTSHSDWGVIGDSGHQTQVTTYRKHLIRCTTPPVPVNCLLRNFSSYTLY